jgi:hypothetical protein
MDCVVIQLILIHPLALFLNLMHKNGVRSMVGGLDSPRRAQVLLPTHQSVQGSLFHYCGWNCLSPITVRSMFPSW